MNLALPEHMQNGWGKTQNAAKRFRSVTSKPNLTPKTNQKGLPAITELHYLGTLMVSPASTVEKKRKSFSSNKVFNTLCTELNESPEMV